MNLRSQPITLSEMLAEYPGKWQFPGDTIVTGITSDSRKVVKGAMFVALSGLNWDGHQFIPDAIQKGASVIVGSENIPQLAVPYLQVSDTRDSLAVLSAAYYRYPARELVMIGVTGTDGKTTTCNLIYSILNHVGLKAGVISTVNALVGGESIDTGFHVTTPEAPDVQRLLRMMVNHGLKYAVIETTSHSLVQKRVLPADFDIGVCTNITHEHLDYHQTYEAYQQAKASLFAGLGKSRANRRGIPVGAVINKDDKSYDFLASKIHVPLISYGFARDSTYKAGAFREYAKGSHWELKETQGPHSMVTYPVETGFFGKYNVHNCLAAIAVSAGVLGIRVDLAIKGIQRLDSIPGRMERIVLGQDFYAFVDFAHTPNALKQVLFTARNILKTRRGSGKVITVFGSAGLRDKEKRKMMSEVSADYADFTILTTEDPRTEDLDGILRDMALGLEFKGKKEGIDFIRVPDRGEAIQFGVDLAKRSDILLVCGKGHEQSMCFGDVEYPWDDRVAVRVALKNKLGIQTESMPYLPTRKNPSSESS